MVKLKRLGVIKTASFLGLFGVLIGLIVAILMWIASLILTSLFSPAGDSGFLSISSILSFNAINLLLFPIGYGIVSFILGLILIPITNLILKIIKGIDLDLEAENFVSQMPVQQTTNYRPPARYLQNYQ